MLEYYKKNRENTGSKSKYFFFFGNRVIVDDRECKHLETKWWRMCCSTLRNTISKLMEVLFSIAVQFVRCIVFRLKTEGAHGRRKRLHSLIT